MDIAHQSSWFVSSFGERNMDQGERRGITAFYNVSGYFQGTLTCGKGTYVAGQFEGDFVLFTPFTLANNRSLMCPNLIYLS